MEFEMTMYPKKEDYWKEMCRQQLNYDLNKCPCCETGKMITVELFVSAKPPPQNHRTTNYHGMDQYC